MSKHEPDALLRILQRALSSAFPVDGDATTPRLPPDLLPFLADVADGDARQALNSLELALQVCSTPLPPMQTKLDGVRGAKSESDAAAGEEVEDGERKREEERDRRLMEAVRKGLRKGYDRSGEERYDMISALHKCIRGSDGSAAMYWLARCGFSSAEFVRNLPGMPGRCLRTDRMITGGEDALYIARRLVVVASEDVGLADPHALPLASSASSGPIGHAERCPIPSPPLIR